MRGIKRILILPSLFLLLLTGAAWAGTPLSDLSQGQTGVIDFHSITPPGIYELITKAPAPQTAIVGTLTFPATVSGKIPAMIVAHHCGGVTKSVTDLGALLNQVGVATFVVDSFITRGFPGGICTSSVKPSTIVAVADVLFALKLLATHPNIDPSRIGIIGQSFGGNAVYTTAFEEVRKSVITDQLKFAVHIGLYPAGCNFRNWSPNMTGAPTLFLLGGADDWTPAAACIEFAELLRSQGALTTVSAIVYPDAPHAWDSPGTVNYNANRTNGGNCRFQYRLDTLQSGRYDTGEILAGSAISAYINSCRTFGATAGRHEATIPLAAADITTFLAKTFFPAAGLNTPPQTGWYWNPAESGRGFFVEKRGGNLFMSGFIYANDSRATWFIAGGSVTDTLFTSSILNYANGQSLTGSYRVPNTTASPGNVILQFSSNTQTTLTWPGGTVVLQRFPFGPGGAVVAPQAGAPESGWWWNASESGRGFAIEIQGNNLFVVGYMYDAAGSPLWYLSGGPMASPTSYSGVWSQFANGQTLFGAYKPASVVNANVGELSINFSNSQNGTMTLPDGRVILLTRFVF